MLHEPCPLNLASLISGETNMPKQIILEATQVNYLDDRGGVHAAAGEIVDVP